MMDQPSDLPHVQPTPPPPSAAEQRLATLVQQLDAVVWEADPETLGSLYISEYVEKVLGYPVDAWLADLDFFLDHLHPEDRERIAAAERELFRTGRNAELEFRMVAADGRTVWFRDLVQVEKDEQERPVRLYGVMLDITEQKRQEAERAQLQRREREAWGAAERRAREEKALRQAAEAISEHFTEAAVVQQIARSALTATNADGAFVEKVDIQTGELEVVAAAGELVPALGARIPFAGSVAEEVLRRGEPELVVRVAEALRTFPGSLIDRCPNCSLLLVPLVDAGETVGALLLLRKPERKGFRPDEIARARIFSNLAALAFGKAHLLDDSERKRIELERVVKSRARLMRGFTHDVKNPLGAADGFLQLLELELQGALGEKQRESVVRTRRALRSALELIDDLLELARAESGQLEIEHQPTDVRTVAREIAEEYRHQAEAASLTLETDLAQEIPLIDSDVSRVRQILGNLVTNAIKHTPGPGRIVVRLCHRDGAPPGRWLAIEVSDTGPGIPSDQLERIFEEFIRLEPHARPGVGLGLSISRQVARALGGEITVQSEVGKGSTFTLLLPLGPPPPHAAP